VAITNAKGKFTLTDVPEGDVVLEAYASERGRGRERAVRVRRGETTRDVRIRLDEEAAAKEGPAAGGVAITLGESGARTKRTITILHVAPGSEAERAGLMPDDVIRSIDRHAPESLEDARKRLSGPLGDDVILELVRDGEGVTVRLSRERVRRLAPRAAGRRRKRVPASEHRRRRGWATGDPDVEIVGHAANPRSFPLHRRLLR